MFFLNTSDSHIFKQRVKKFDLFSVSEGGLRGYLVTMCFDKLFFSEKGS